MSLPPDPHPSRTGRSPLSSGEGWNSTRVQTQIAARHVHEVAPGAAGPDIGRAVGAGVRELFVACEPADALMQQFDHLQPEFVTVHDLGLAASRKLLAGIAAASQRSVQRLAIRRNGAGTALATVEFVDCPAANGRTVRLYGTEVDADAPTREAVARVLLARARLGLVLVGELPAQALQATFTPWREAITRGHWVCRRMLFMPLTAGAALPAEVARFRAATAIDATSTAQVTRPADVWIELCHAWNAWLRQTKPGQDAAALPLLGTSAEAPPRPAPPARSAAPDPRNGAPSTRSTAPVSRPTPMPAVSAPAPLALDEPLERYLDELVELAGVVSACAFDLSTGQPVGHAGARPGPDDLARHGSAVLESLMSASHAMGLGAVLPEAAITLGQHHLLLRPLPGHPGLALHVVLDKPQVSLALAQLQIRRLDDALLSATRHQPPHAASTRS